MRFNMIQPLKHPLWGSISIDLVYHQEKEGLFSMLLDSQEWICDGNGATQWGPIYFSSMTGSYPVIPGRGTSRCPWCWGLTLHNVRLAAMWAWVSAHESWRITVVLLLLHQGWSLVGGLMVGLIVVIIDDCEEWSLNDHGYSTERCGGVKPSVRSVSNHPA